MCENIVNKTLKIVVKIRRKIDVIAIFREKSFYFGKIMVSKFFRNQIL